MILFLADVPYNGMKQRPQELAYHLSQDEEVVYAFTGKRWNHYKSGNVEVYELPSVQYNSRYAWMRWISYNLAWFADSFLQPFWAPVLRVGYDLVICESVQLSVLCFASVIRCPVIYDCIDQWDAFCPMPRLMRKRHASLVANCDLVTVTHEGLAPDGVEFRVVGNAADQKLFTDIHMVAGYAGVIGDYIDWQWVKFWTSRPGWKMVMVGPVRTKIPDIPGLVLIPEVPHDALPYIMLGWDIYVIPWLKTPLTEHVDAVKAHEAKAAGLPLHMPKWMKPPQEKWDWRDRAWKLRDFGRNIESFKQWMESY